MTQEEERKITEEERKISCLEGKIHALEYTQRYVMEALIEQDERQSLTKQFAGFFERFVKEMKLEEADFKSERGNPARTEFLLGFQSVFSELSNQLRVPSKGSSSLSDFSRFPKPGDE